MPWLSIFNKVVRHKVICFAVAVKQFVYITDILQLEETSKISTHPFLDECHYFEIMYIFV